MSTLDNYNRWLNSSRVDEATKEVLRNMNQQEIDDAFFTEILDELKSDGLSDLEEKYNSKFSEVISFVVVVTCSVKGNSVWTWLSDSK